jgi:hypothetical protein
MAFTSKEATRLMTAVLLAAAALPAEVRFEVTHEHLRNGCRGTMVVDDHGISFQGAKKHVWHWSYSDIQELKLGPHSILVTSGHTFEFQGDIPAAVYAQWKDRLDQRFVAELAEPQAQPEWRIPVRHLAYRGGSEGVIEIGRDRIVYATTREKDARTWRFGDIENISSSGPFQLTITTFERARLDYGDRKAFNFELKEALSESRYDNLWRKINRENGRIQIP